MVLTLPGGWGLSLHLLEFSSFCPSPLATPLPAPA